MHTVGNSNTINRTMACNGTRDFSFRNSPEDSVQASSRATHHQRSGASKMGKAHRCVMFHPRHASSRFWI